MIRSAVRTARKPWPCERCPGGIRPGEQYRELTASPSHDGITPDCWATTRECADCTARCGRPLDTSQEDP